MSNFIVTDCLVLKLDEIDSTNRSDTTLYILYDKEAHTYVIRGHRRQTRSLESFTYSFNCEFAEDVADFVQYVMCKSNDINETLYNYNNLPYESNDITYEFLNETQMNELSGYDSRKQSRNRLLKNLRMLRNIHNRYI
jgi:hypothetical protein